MRSYANFYFFILCGMSLIGGFWISKEFGFFSIKFWSITFYWCFSLLFAMLFAKELSQENAKENK